LNRQTGKNTQGLLEIINWYYFRSPLNEPTLQIPPLTTGFLIHPEKSFSNEEIVRFHFICDLFCVYAIILCCQQKGLPG